MMNTETDLLQIESIYDPLSRRGDGVITPYAPIMVTVSGTLPAPGERAEFCLQAEGTGELMSVARVYFHTDSKVVVTLPYLPRGAYHPLMKVYCGNKLVRTLHCPDKVVWTVEEEVK